MSQEDVEIVMRGVEAVRRRDADAFIALVSPEVKWEDAVFWSEPTRVYRGEVGVREWFQATVEPWDSIDIEVRGETGLARPTADGVSEQLNRRVDARIFRTCMG